MCTFIRITTVSRANMLYFSGPKTKIYQFHAVESVNFSLDLRNPGSKPIHVTEMVKNTTMPKTKSWSDNLKHKPAKSKYSSNFKMFPHH